MKQGLKLFNFLEDPAVRSTVAEKPCAHRAFRRVITVNLAEARRVNRGATAEPWESLSHHVVRHFRHESGHYYSQTRLMNTLKRYNEFSGALANGERIMRP